MMKENELTEAVASVCLLLAMALSDRAHLLTPVFSKVPVREANARPFRVLGPVSRKPRKVFGPVKPFLVHLYLKTEKCIRLKLLV